MARHRLFLDTNICSRIAYQNLEKEAAQVRRYIKTKYEYVVSPLTLTELLIKIGRGNEPYFEKNRKSLQVLIADQNDPVFLDFPGSHLLRHILGRPAVAKFGPADFNLWIKVVLQASTLADLQKGAVDIGDTDLVFGLDFGVVDAQQQEGKDDHRRILEGIRDGSRNPASPLEWAADTLAQVGQDPKPEDCAKVAAALEAAYRFDQYLWKQAKNHSYDFRKHDSDWIDRQQLFYMLDQQVVFVTDDRNILQETKKTSQGVRILAFESLLGEAQSGFERDGPIGR